MFKNLILAAITCSLICTVALAKKNKEIQVPDAVKKEFAAKFPKVKVVTWEMEDKKNFEAEFTSDGKKMSAEYDKAGKWLETEYKININDIPDNIKKDLEKDYSGFNVKYAEKAETYDKGIVFEVVIKSATEKYELVFSQDGKLLEKEMKGKNKK